MTDVATEGIWWFPDVEEDGAGKEESRGSREHRGHLGEGEDGSAEEVRSDIRMLQLFTVAERRFTSQQCCFVPSIYKKAGVGKEKREVTYVVTKKGAGRKVRRPPGVKGAFKVVDSRLKKDMRGMQRKDQRAKGGKGKRSKGGKGSQKSGKGRK